MKKAVAIKKIGEILDKIKIKTRRKSLMGSKVVCMKRSRVYVRVGIKREATELGRR